MIIKRNVAKKSFYSIIKKSEKLIKPHVKHELEDLLKSSVKFMFF